MSELATTAAAAWLIMGTSAYGGTAQGLQAVRYGSMGECQAAVRKVHVAVKRPDASMSIPPHCTEKKPTWWIDIDPPPARRAER